MSLSPKKHLGQHFLKELHYAQRIVDLVPSEPHLPVIEIGPGEGVLTGMLIERLGHLSAIEIDTDAVQHLGARFSKDQLTIVFTDVLRWNPRETLSGPAHFVGNLPYNISSPIFFHLLENRDLMASGVFMLQKEVAERICAGPGSKTFGILSVLIGAYFDREYCVTVPPGAFRPPPKVQSGVIRLTPTAHPPQIEFSQLKAFVKQAFSQRRKTLRNSLKGFPVVGISDDDPRWAMRAEQLSIADFVQMAGGTCDSP
ncbi:MAG: 16S rRNA (adenine(1518)-N(6)/adenine(1519)-N(6))-dimethyltransferase RsmA [Bacteroidia bacterium]|nr:16S rRNA (adenine(1518)-N(6)/adenine(1519)-N(6))-dimethyltransferase RsmA [Bacteroidia bacterium]